MPAGLSLARGDIALVFTAAAAGTITSGPFANSGDAAVVLASVHVTALTGTTPTVALTIEESATGSGSWTAVPGSTTTALTAAGVAQVMVAASKSFVRASVVVGGTGVSATGSVPVIVYSD